MKLLIVSFFFSLSFCLQPPRYKDIGADILEYLSDENVQKIPVKPIKYPNLDFLKTFGKQAKFCTFIPRHMEYAKALMKIFDSAKDLDELISLALYCRDQINTQLFIYVYTIALTHRYDSDNIELPQLFEIAPHHFFKKSTLAAAKEKSHVTAEKKRRRRQTNTNNNDNVDDEVLISNFVTCFFFCHFDFDCNWFE